MDLTKYHSFHFIGIGGMGMRALAVILLDKGERISGSDVADSPFLRDFRKKGAEIYIGHEASHVKGADCVVISSAISEEIQSFWKRDVLVFPYSIAPTCWRPCSSGAKA